MDIVLPMEQGRRAGCASDGDEEEALGVKHADMLTSITACLHYGRIKN